MSNELESYAAHVHKQLLIALTKLNHGRHEEAEGALDDALLAARDHLALLMTEAANIKEGRRMEREASDPGRYDLAALPEFLGSTEE